MGSSKQVEKSIWLYASNETKFSPTKFFKDKYSIGIIITCLSHWDGNSICLKVIWDSCFLRPEEAQGSL